MIYVCDAIMGSGKSSAAIRFINAHPEKRFIYVAVYLDEAERIKNACPRARFIEPSNKIEEFNFKKSQHIKSLIEEGRNIATTHVLLLSFGPELVRLIHDQGYTVIIDEAISVLVEDKSIKQQDIDIALREGLICETGKNEYRRTDKPYDGTVYEHLLQVAESRPLVRTSEKACDMWAWVIPDGLLTAAADTYILTYLFKGSELEAYLKCQGAEYQYIGVCRTEDGGYVFTKDRSRWYTPEYVQTLDQKLHILDREKMNAVGEPRNSLSMHWYDAPENKDLVDRTRKNVDNFFRGIHPEILSDKRMVGVYEKIWGRMRSKGFGDYEKNRVIFSQRSSNKWADYTALAYPVNIIINPKIARFYKDRGQQVDGDVYALSIMIQWIWRSAIRNGQEVWLYLPSKRMRTLLTRWMASIKARAAGGMEHEQ